MDAKQFGERVRQAREQLGISQEDLAANVGKDQRSISEYENGKRRLSVTDLPALAAALKVPINYFFEDGNEISAMDQALLYYFNELPTLTAKQVAIDILQSFSKAFEAD